MKPSEILAPLGPLAPLYAVAQINSQHVRKSQSNKEPQLVCMDTNPIEAQNETDNVPLQLGITAFVHYEPSGSLKLEFQSGHEDKGYKVIV